MNAVSWYVPSWNGDIRFEAESDDATVVKVIKPTAGEIVRLRHLTTVFHKEGWLKTALWNDAGDPAMQVQVVKASILDVAKHIVTAYAPGKATLTAIKIADDKVEAYEAGEGIWTALAKALGRRKPKTLAASPLPGEEKNGDSYRTEAPEEKKEEPKVEKKKEEKKKEVVSVKRPTVCCPQCIAGPLAPAAEVLFAFLSEDEKREYIENDHSIVVHGNLTGHRYLLSHRHGRWARYYGKICRDLDFDQTLHFHDHTVPPEEELLAAKLILEHREHWLRTHGSGAFPTFWSGFGDGSDGTRSTTFTHQLGGALKKLEEAFVGKPPRRRARNLVMRMTTNGNFILENE